MRTTFSEDICFIGVLTNTDSSILQLTLEHGFKVEAISEKEGVALISALEGVTHPQALQKMFLDFPCLNHDEKMLYIIRNSFEGMAKTKHEVCSLKFLGLITNLFVVIWILLSD